MIKTIEYVYYEEKLEIFKNLTCKDSLILSNNSILKDCLGCQTNVFSSREFYEYIIRKSPQINKAKTLSDFSAIYIINSLINAIFIDNEALYTLTKSEAFSRELYTLFGSFIECGVTAEYLLNTLNKSDIILSDKLRLEKIFTAYSAYIETVKGLGFIDHRELPAVAEKIICSSYEFQCALKNKFKNIILDEPQQYSNKEINLFTKIAENIFFVVNIFYDTIITTDEVQTYDKYIDDKILDRSKILANKYFEQNHKIKLEKTQSVRYKTFADIKDEIEFVSNDIISKVSAKSHDFKDFAIVSRNSDTNKLINNIFTIKNIPINTKYEDIIFKNFVLNLTQSLNLCRNLTLLGAKNIYETNPSNLRVSSKYKLEAIYNEINMNFENLLSSALENQFIKDKFLDLKNTKNNLSLLYTAKNNFEVLNSNDKKKLTNELNRLEKIFDFYNNGKIIDIIVFSAKNCKTKSSDFNANLAKLISKIKSLTDLSLNLKKQTIDINSVIETINMPLQDCSGVENAVKIENFNNNNSHKVKTLYIIDLIEKNIPKINTCTQFISEKSDECVSKLIQNDYNGFEGIIPKPEKNLKNEAKLFVRTILNAEDEVIFSAHLYEEKKQAVLSPFFIFLNELDFQNADNAAISANEDNEIFKQLPFPNLKPETSVISQNETITLNASAISTFQACPRKFYYKHLLKLKETGTFSAAYGTAVHTIMENFNRNYLNEYSAETLKTLADKLFNSQNQPELASTAGFKQDDIKLICETDPLSLAEMKEQFDCAIVELDKKGFFSQIPDEVLTEKKFQFISDKIPNIAFDGRIDAVYKFGDRYVIADFKTGKTKDALSYLVSEYGVNFKTKTGRDSTDIEGLQKKYDYQIPLYYLAVQNSEEFKDIKDKVTGYELLYIRPKDKEEGYLKDSISSENLSEYEDRIIKNLVETVIDKIKGKKYFEPEADERICADCAFKIICSSEKSEALDE